MIVGNSHIETPEAGLMICLFATLEDSSGPVVKRSCALLPSDVKDARNEGRRIAGIPHTAVTE